MKKVCRYLFHVLAHIYCAHFKETVALELQGHLNTLYAHFIVFVREFNLIDPKETCIMDDLSEVLCAPLPPHTHNHVTERWGWRRRTVRRLPIRHYFSWWAEGLQFSYQHRLVWMFPTGQNNLSPFSFIQEQFIYYFAFLLSFFFFAHALSEVFVSFRKWCFSSALIGAFELRHCLFICNNV